MSNTLVRASHPSTSWEAAEKAALGRSAVRAAVLTVIRDNSPLTHDELLAAYYQKRILDPSIPRASQSGIRTRLHELVDAGLVVAHPNRDGRSSFGNRARLWCAVDEHGVVLTGDDAGTSGDGATS